MDHGTPRDSHLSFLGRRQVFISDRFGGWWSLWSLRVEPLRAGRNRTLHGLGIVGRPLDVFAGSLLERRQHRYCSRRSSGREQAIDLRNLVCRGRYTNMRKRFGTPEVGHSGEALSEQRDKVIGPVIAFDEPPQGSVGRRAPVVVLPVAGSITGKSQ